MDIGVSAFLPGSQVDTRPVHELEPLIGQEIKVLVVKVNRRRANVVVSRRELLAAEFQALKQETLSKLKEGEPITGRVKNITSYGVFVDLGGIDGLIHMTRHCVRAGERSSGDSAAGERGDCPHSALRR